LIGIDWSTDTYDGGVHLNVLGAEKMTSYFGQMLAEKYRVESLKTDNASKAVWDQKLAEYKTAKQQMTEETQK
jgi:hypothetical protein